MIRTRLQKLEYRRLEEVPRLSRIFDHGELGPCSLHPNCDVELATGEHYQAVIHLRFDVAWQP